MKNRKMKKDLQNVVATAEEMLMMDLLEDSVLAGVCTKWKGVMNVDRIKTFFNTRKNISLCS
jgi:hypothetical protein